MPLNAEIRDYDFIGARTIYEQVHSNTIAISNSTSVRGIAVFAPQSIGLSNELRIQLRSASTSNYPVDFPYPSPRISWTSWELTPEAMWQYRKRRGSDSLIFDLTGSSASDTVTTMQIPSALVRFSDSEAFQWLTNEPRFISYANALVENATTELQRRHLEFDTKITTFAEPEEEDESMLIIEFKIRGRAYSEVIDIWNALSLELYRQMPAEVADKIALVMEDY